jgi:hypothetical protein
MCAQVAVRATGSYLDTYILYIFHVCDACYLFDRTYLRCTLHGSKEMNTIQNYQSFNYNFFSFAS